MTPARPSWRRAAPLALAALGCTPDVELLKASADASVADAPTPRWSVAASGTTRDLRAVWGTGADDVWAVGDGGTAIRWDGAAWRAVPTGTSASLSGVWAARPDDAWAVGANPDGSGVVLRWNGARWGPTPSPVRGRAALRAVWGSGAGEVWAVRGPSDGPDPSVWRWDGATWRSEAAPGERTTGLTAVAGRGPDVWFVGEGSAVLHRGAGAWDTPMAPPRGATFTGGLCVADDGAAWATGAMGAVYRHAASTWTAFAPEPSASPRGLWCAAPDDVWAVGDNARASHWDGAAWSLEPLPRGRLAAVWGRGNTLWAVGAQGAVLRRER